MDHDESDDAAKLEELATYAARNAPEARATLQAGGHGGHANESVRQATYKGHQITIRTSYQIEVDGVPVEGHLGVTNDGRVHYHVVPNVSFASAVELVKQLIDIFPDDFHPADTQHPDQHQHQHGEEA